MYRKQVNEHSPIRILEQSIHGGLGKGNLGVVMARAGVGKTACLVHLGLAATARAHPHLATCPKGHIASISLDLASLLLPLGFFLGGLWHYAGDPGLGVLLVPVGGALLVVAALLVLLALRAAPP